MQSVLIPSAIPSGADDAALLADIAAIRQSLIAERIVCRMGPDPFWSDVLDVIAAVDPLPKDVLVIWTVLEDADALSDPAGWRASHANKAPNLPPAPSSSSDSPMRNGAEQRIVDPSEPEPELKRADPYTLERVMRMSRRRQLKPYHTGEHIALTDAGGETRYSGTVSEVYEALKADTVKQLPPTPVQALRDRLSRVAGWDWSLVADFDGRYTLVRNDIRMFTGELEELEQIAASRILNTTPNWGFPE